MTPQVHKELNTRGWQRVGNLINIVRMERRSGTGGANRPGVASPFHRLFS